MKQRRERKHNYLDVENKTTYGRVNSNQIESRKPNPLSSLYHLCCLFGFGDLCQPQNLIFLCAYEVLRIIKMRCNMLTLQQR